MNTPHALTDAEINALVDHGLMPAAIRDRSARVIDLQRRMKIEVERAPTLHRLSEYTARDLITFDPDPEMRWHVIGSGTSPQAAVLDLLDKLTELRS